MSNTRDAIASLLQETERLSRLMSEKLASPQTKTLGALPNRLAVASAIETLGRDL